MAEGQLSIKSSSYANVLCTWYCGASKSPKHSPACSRHMANPQPGHSTGKEPVPAPRNSSLDTFVSTPNMTQLLGNGGADTYVHGTGGRVHQSRRSKSRLRCARPRCSCRCRIRGPTLGHTEHKQVSHDVIHTFRVGGRAAYRP